jgi:hypothetical protein
MRGVVIFVIPHRLCRPVDQEVMDEVAVAQGRKFVAVKQPMQPIAGKFGD